ncbi:MAG: hypothetical protein RIR32_612 [Verrucomicrobiota bacterium]|jgi:hypothetical protein
MESMKTLLTLGCAGLAAYLAEGCAGAPAAGWALPDLAVHQWRHRVLVIDAPKQATDDYRRQLAWLDAAKAGLPGRELHLVTRTGAPAFRVRLVGKDGGVKLDQATPLDVATLFALIDAMPMRRAEMSSR